MEDKYTIFTKHSCSGATEHGSTPRSPRIYPREVATKTYGTNESLGDWASPYDWAYFCKLSFQERQEATDTAKRNVRALGGTKYAPYMSNCGPAEKAGERVLERFLDYFGITYTTNRDPYMSPFMVGSYTIDVHTRVLKFSEQYAKYGVTGGNLSMERFLGVVPELGLLRAADLYVFCGFDICSYEGFLFGWTDSGRLSTIDLSQDCKYPAKFIEMTALYTPHSLLECLQ